MTLHVIATGGTIASHLGPDGWGQIGGRQLVDELVASGLLRSEPHARLVVDDVATGPSSNLSVDDMWRITDEIHARLAAGSEGVVITHGTDTLELTAFLTHLRRGAMPGDAPVVFTGSMRVHSHPEPDGPRNLSDALVLASSSDARSHGVLVVTEGVVHRADRVRKVDARSVDAFTSSPLAPVGSIRGGDLTLAAAELVGPAATGLETRVPLLTCVPGMSGHEFERTLGDAPAIVIDGFGDLHVPQSLWGPVHAASRRGVLVVLASSAFTDTSGSDDLDLLGAIGAGGLTAQKARLLVMSALGSTPDITAARQFVAAHRLAYDPGLRRTDG
jgi:L-asparaginase